METSNQFLGGITILFVITLIIGLIGNKRKIGFWGVFIIGFGLGLLVSFMVNSNFGLLTGIIASIIAAVISPSKESIEQNAKLLEEQKRTNEILSNKVETSITTELTNLQQMRSNGTLTESEYEKLRSRIIDGKQII